MTPSPSRADGLSQAQLLARIDELVELAGHGGGSFALLLVSLEPKDRLISLSHPGFHPALDEALAGLPEILRPVDAICRQSAFELCILLPDLSNSTQAWLAAHKISKTISTRLRDEADEALLKALIGIAAYPQHAHSSRALLIRADEAREQARMQIDGIFSPPIDSPVEQEPYGRETMLEVLRANQFHLVYQPKLDLLNGRCESAEALLRSDAPGGSISPARIAQFAEREGKISQLTASVLNIGLRQIRAWLDAGVAINVAVNLSPLSLRDDALPAMVSRALRAWEVPAQLLTLEIVESSMIENFQQAADLLQELKHLGIRLSIDDFGTGYSCLAYLRRLPLDELKVDRSFVRNLERSRADRQLVRGIIDLAHNFDMKAVAEGVESTSMWTTLAEMGCDYLQGFAFSRPLEAGNFADWLHNQAPKYHLQHRAQEGVKT